MSPDDDRIRQTVVLTCAAGHPVVIYYGRRDEPRPPCPVCGRKDQA